MLKIGWLRRRRWVAVAMVLACVGVSWGASAPTAHAQLITLARRVNLNVLVLSAGDVGTEMVKAGLREGGVPFTEVNLLAANRPRITASYLAGAASLFVKRANFQAIVTPNEAPSQLTAAEVTALAAYQREFRIRRFSAYVYPNAAVGMGVPTFSGVFDGLTANVNAAGKANHFGYLNGPVPFEDIAPTVAETWGYLAAPLAANTVNRRSFTSFVDVPVPGTSTNGVLLGVYNDNGREEMILTCAINQYQFQQQALFQGILNWLTYGVHLGTERNFFSLHVDDVFLGDARWDRANNCTVGDDCGPEITLPDIIMTPADVDYLIAWQQSNSFKLDLAYNGSGHAEALASSGSFPLGARLIANRTQFRWINHSYTHMYLGCIQDFSTVPFRCATNAAGQILWTTRTDLDTEIGANVDFATQYGIPLNTTELITGEHSGLRRTPQEPSDNPSLGASLNAERISWIAADNSRESVQRRIGNAITVPRYPMNIYYNTGTKAEAVDEFNWIYTSVEDGGSGLCEINPLSTCISPLNPDVDFDRYIVPLEVRIAMLHVLSNSPRPHYAHQSNLAEDRILYPVIAKLLADYKRVFATTAAIVNPTMSAAGTELRAQADWATTRSRVSAYIQSGRLVLDISGSGTINVPLTVPTGAGALPSTIVNYGGYRTGWRSGSTDINLTLPTSVAYTR
jgi:hypothetical protein